MRAQRLGCLGMEEKPPSERRGAPRARSARPAFSAPDQPVQDEKADEQPPRRATKAAPAVTFQAPSAEDHPGVGHLAPALENVRGGGFDLVVKFEHVGSVR